MRAAYARKEARVLRAKLLTGGLALCAAGVISSPAAAQSAADPASKDELEEVVVTATGTNISGVAPVGSETLTISRDEMLQLGADNVADVVRTLPQVQNLGFDEAARDGNAVATPNPTRGTSINLRGIGQSATLVLVDGHRLTPAGTAAAFLEAIQVPFAAIERIEVIADGASAVYGSDAISGVVNYVLRKDLDGVELSGRYSTNSYGDDWTGSLTGGTNWQGFGFLGRGNVIASYEHVRQNNINRSDLPWYRQDLRGLGGLDNRINNNNATPSAAGNIVVAGTTPNTALPRAGTWQYYALPAGTNGVGLSFANLAVNQPNLVDRSDFEDYLPRTERNHVTLLANQDIGASWNVYYEGFWAKRDTVTRTFYSQNANANLTVTLPTTSPWYIAGIPGTAGQPLTVQYNMLAHVPVGTVFLNETPEETFSHTAGIRGKLPGEWNADLYYTYGSVENCGVCYLDFFVNADQGNALQRAVSNGLINPLSTERLTQAQWDLIRGSNIQTSQNRLNDTVIKFDGPLFSLPGGRVRAAIGAEYAHQVNRLQNGAQRAPAPFPPPPAGTPDTFLWDAQVDEPRYQSAAFTELYVPIVGNDNAKPFMRSLSLSAAFRYDKYSDFGSTTNPKVGFTWELTDELALRGSWGTSFRAPWLTEMNNGIFSVAFSFPTFNGSGDPSIPTTNGQTQALFLIGGNPDLEAEEGETWSAGFDWKPLFADGLKVSGTYYRITYDSRITAPAIFGMINSPQNRAAYANLIHPIAANPNCVQGNPATYDPALVAALSEPNLPGQTPLPGFNGRSYLYGTEGLLFLNLCSVGVILDAQNTNAAATMQDGVDVMLSYSFDALSSFWNVGFSASKILTNEEQIVSGTAMNDVLDRIGRPNDLRARANINWGRGSWNAMLSANYVDSYLNDRPIVVNNVPLPQSEVPTWTTVDLNVGYSVPQNAGWSALEGVRVGATIQNLLDRDPPTVLSGTTGNDAQMHNPLGRIWQFSVTKRF
jgi:iron complex outermembrane receptor protein